MADEYGAGNFEFKITGGDRYLSNDGLVISTSNHNVIPNSGPTSPHLIENGARAVDLRIRDLNGNTFNHNLIRPIANQNNLFYNPNFLPGDYGDGHHHLKLLRR